MLRTIAIVVAFLAASALTWGIVALSISSPVSERTPLELAAPPTAEPEPATPTTSPPSTGVPEAPPTTVAGESEPIFDFVVDSGRFSDRATIEQGPLPTRITIDDISITAPIAPVGYVPETNEMEVPTSHDLVGWYEFGPTPGSPEGSSVLAAHVDYNGRKGVFFDLSSIDVGSLITVDFDDGTERRFTVVGGQQYDKETLPVDDIFAKSGDPVLTLITCGGAFDSSARSYEDNVVVYAVPVDSYQ